jgi:hypothetical protein
MTTLTVVRVGLFALTIVALSFVPGVSVAQSPSATGSGHFLVDGQLRTFSFSAIQQPNGKVAGQAELHSRASGAVFHMAIDCLRFIGENAVFVSGIITNSNMSTLVGHTGTFLAQDNGEGKNSSPDQLSGLAVDAGDCNSDLALGTTPIDHGNIQVRPAE